MILLLFAEIKILLLDIRQSTAKENI